MRFVLHLLLPKKEKQLFKKLYCSILNNRLSRLLELNDGLADEQNGFRRGRCTGDHITSLSMIESIDRSYGISYL